MAHNKDLQIILDRMKRVGVKIDEAALTDTIEAEMFDLEENLTLLKKVVADTSGISVEEVSVSDKKSRVVINSSRHMAMWIFGTLGAESEVKTASGNVSLSAKALTKIGEKHKEVLLLRDYRLIAWNVRYLLNLQDSIYNDGICHPDWAQDVACSGRLTCKNPALQQMPESYRHLVVADKGRALTSFDLSQAEYALAYQLAGLPPVKDVHDKTASDLGVSRSVAKIINLGNLYGIGVRGLATNLDIPKEEARDLWKRMSLANRTMNNYIDRFNEQAFDSMSVTTRSGRDVPLSAVDSMGRPFSILVQGSLADLMAEAMVETEKYIAEQGIDARVAMTIHDELVIDHNEGLSKDHLKAIEIIFTTVGGYIFDASSKTGKHWQK